MQKKLAAGAILKSLYPKLFHAICLAHLLHIWAIKVKSSYFEDVDQLIANVKLTTVKTNPDKPDLLLLVTCCSVLLKVGKLVKCCLILCKEFS